MDQITFSEAEYQTKKRKTRREIFLERMDKLIPWKQLEKKVALYYPKGQTGRPPYPLPTMLRTVPVGHGQGATQHSGVTSRCI